MDNNFSKVLEEKISDCMRTYNLTDDDVKMGSAGQMKGFVMGLKEAKRLFESMGSTSNSSEKETPTEEYTVRSRRTRRN